MSSHPETPPYNLNNELAKERNREAAERTLMAWIRTCLSMISFGFGIDKIVGALARNRLGSQAHADLSVRLICISFILLGLFALFAAVREHQVTLKLIRRDDYLYSPPRSIGIATAIALIGIGFFAFLLLLTGIF
jgi:putative membrane protein